jgi:hypothetical protein
MTVRSFTLGAVLLVLAAATSRAQQEGALPRSEVESLIDAGRWTEAEELLYARVRARPRDPIARARLGQYLAMRGALRPGLVLVEEAGEFGLPASTVRALAAPIQTLLDRGEDIWPSVSDSPLHAVGRRYPVLRTEREVRVLLAPGRVRSLDEALRELTPRWWQLDLPHGALVTR